MLKHEAQQAAAKLSQCEIVKRHLMAGKPLTTIEAFSLYNITCLAQRVRDLRQRHGHIINSTPVLKNGKRYVVYTWADSNDQHPVTELTPANDTAGV